MKAYIVGVGMTKFEKPETRDWQYWDMVREAGTGTAALLMLARQFVEGGSSDCVLALGFEKMARGSLGGGTEGGGDFASSPVARHYGIMAAAHGFAMSPPTAQIFGNAAREHMRRYGTTPAQLAAVGAKNHRHSVDNPYAQFQDPYTVEEILAARTVHDPLTKLQCSPTSDGAAAAVVVSERFVERHGLR
ncbi:Nonspecific lipid-transfer protein, partial [Streptomyces sp. MBT57]|nr:Nonspecific lipid-transfer protein [Streptomyces sp. MBT57]